MAKLGKLFAAGVTVAAAAGTVYVLANKEKIAERGKVFLEKLKEKGIIEIEFGESADFDEDCCAEEDFECAVDAAECAAEAAECAAEAAEAAAEAAECAAEAAGRVTEAAEAAQESAE